MPTTTAKKLSFLMRANPDQANRLERLIEHTGQRMRTKAVWTAIERYPGVVAELADARQEIARLEGILHRASAALDAVDLAVADRAVALREIRSVCDAPDPMNRPDRARPAFSIAPRLAGQPFGCVARDAGGQEATVTGSAGVRPRRDRDALANRIPEPADMERNSRKLIRMLRRDGWFHVGTGGSHWHFRHPTIPGRVTIPHPREDVGRNTATSIYNQAHWPTDRRS